MRENGNFKRNKSKPGWRSRTVRTLDRSTEDGPVETVQSDVRPRSEHQRKWNLESGTYQKIIINTRAIFFVRTSPILVVGEVPFLTLIGKTWKAHPWVEIGGKRISRNLTKTYTK